MSDRYKQVKLYDNFKFCPESPLDILKGAIYIDNATNKAVFQLKFVNMQSKEIKAIYVQIKGSNDLGEELENKEYQYLDMNVYIGEEFGTEQLKELNNNTIRNIDITINKVIYTNNEFWENKNTVAYDRMSLQKVDDDLLSFASRRATEQQLHLNNIYYPTENKNYWTCICGSFNSISNNTCYKCGCNKDTVFSQYLKEKLQEDFKNYNEQERQKKNLKNKKIKKLFLICVPIIIIFLVIFHFWNIEHNKSNNYKEAIEKYNNRQFDEAITLFTELEDYKDSKSYIEQSNNGKEDLKTINKCISFYEKQSKYIYDECKTLGTKFYSNKELRIKDYNGAISSIYSLRETYLKRLNELKTNNFNEEKAIIIKVDEIYTKLYNYYFESPKQNNYTEYINGAYSIYKDIEEYTKELESLKK